MLGYELLLGKKVFVLIIFTWEIKYVSKQEKNLSFSFVKTMTEKKTSTKNRYWITSWMKCFKNLPKKKYKKKHSKQLSFTQFISTQKKYTWSKMLDCPPPTHTQLQMTRNNRSWPITIMAATNKKWQLLTVTSRLNIEIQWLLVILLKYLYLLK